MSQAKHIQLLTLLVFIGLAVAGFSSASAKTCSTQGTGAACATGHGNVYAGASNAVLTAGKKATIEAGEFSITCTESALESEFAAGEKSTGKIIKVTFGGCTSVLGTCTVVAGALPWAETAVLIANTKAKNEIANLTVTTMCGVITCRYSKNNVGANGEILITGGETAERDINAALLKEEGGPFCPGVVNWVGEYLITVPDSVFIT